MLCVVGGKLGEVSEPRHVEETLRLFYEDGCLSDHGSEEREREKEEVPKMWAGLV